MKMYVVFLTFLIGFGCTLYVGFYRIDGGVASIGNGDMVAFDHFGLPFSYLTQKTYRIEVSSEKTIVFSSEKLEPVGFLLDWLIFSATILGYALLREKLETWRSGGQRSEGV